MPQALANTDIDSATTIRPRVLVADDDPASCQFLGDGLRSLGATVETFREGVSALDRARTHAFDLLLLDCRMPGAGALQIITELHESMSAKSADSITVATTAELDPGDREKLLAAGVRAILMKPCGLADLQSVLAMVVNTTTHGCTLDDQAGLRASGDATTMRALRLLLREELVVLERELDALSLDAPALQERLHRLRSSCGFCGAIALSEQTALLQQRLNGTAPRQTAMIRFRRSLSSTLQSLNG